MSAILQGPWRPLQPSLTEEQFICQHPPVLLRYLIPLFFPGAMDNTHSQITPKSIKRAAVEGTWGAQEQVSALNDCNRLLTATRPDKQCHYYGMRVCVLAVRCGCIEMSFPQHTAVKGDIMFITRSLLHPQHICVLSVVTSGYDFTVLLSLWLSSRLFTQLLKLKKKKKKRAAQATSLTPYPGLSQLCVIRTQPYTSQQHSVWLNVWYTV